MIRRLSRPWRFVVRTIIWLVFIVAAGFLPFGTVWLWNYLFGGSQGFGDVIHAGDVVLISTAIAAGAAADLYVTASDRVPRWLLNVDLGLAIAAFIGGCFLYAFVSEAQASAASAQVGVSNAQEAVDTATKVAIPADAYPPGTPPVLTGQPQLIEANQRVLQQKTAQSKSADKTLDHRNTVAFWVFVVSLAIGVFTIAIEVIWEPTPHPEH